MTAHASDRISLYLSITIAVVLVLLPFHALLTTWVGSNTGHLDAVRIWKELIIFALIPITLRLILKDKALKTWLLHNWLPRLLFLYMLVHVGVGLVALKTDKVNNQALIYGLLANLRFLGFFLIAYAASWQSTYLKRHWKAIVIVPATVVIVFGLLQRFVLPHDFLRHFGYGPKTIPAFQTVDQKLDYRRIQSTLRGANPLGAYLIVVLPLLALVRRRKIAASIFATGLLATMFTYSRSAWLGLLLALGAYTYLTVPTAKMRKQLVAFLVVLSTVTGLTIITLRHSVVVQNNVFHTDSTSRSLESSNASRARALESGLGDLAREPLGRGPGTAGPASARNNHPARLAENYYVQIGQEVGWLGSILFVAIIGIVGYELWKRRADNLCRALFAVLLGISFVNLLSHAWADDTLGLIWWGLAGIALSPGILKTKQKHNEIPATKKATTRT